MANRRIRKFANDSPEPKLYRGRINKSATKGSDLLPCLIPALFAGEDFVTDPLPFDRRVDGVLPAKGDACLVGIDHGGAAWLIKYEPATGVPHAEEH